jgi:hypothetical protein
MTADHQDLVHLIDQAIAEASKVNPGGQAERCGRLIAGLQAIRQQALSGALEPSQGGSTLGLSREVADWIESLDAPLLKAVGAIERFYQERYRP